MSTDSVSPTVATALTLTLLTKKTSTTANNDSITISRIIGTDRKKMALLILPDVKSCSPPLTADRKLAIMDLIL